MNTSARVVVPTQWPPFVQGYRSNIHVRLHNPTDAVWRAAGDCPVVIFCAWICNGRVEVPATTSPVALPHDLEPNGRAHIWPTLNEAPASASHLRVIALGCSPHIGSRHVLLSQDQPVQILRLEDYAAGRLSIPDLPPLPAGVKIGLKLGVVNTGKGRWHAEGRQQVEIVATWSDGTHVAATLPADIHPGEAADANITLTTPATPGTYSLRLSLCRRVSFDFSTAATFAPAAMDVVVVPEGDADVPSSLVLEVPRLRAMLPGSADPLAIVGQQVPLSLRVHNDGELAVEIKSLEWTLHGPEMNAVDSGQQLLNWQGVGAKPRSATLSLNPIDRPGPYSIEFHLQARLAGDDYVRVFAGRITLTVLGQEDSLRGEIAITQCPVAVICNESVTVALHVHNTGEGSWAAYGPDEVYLRCQWTASGTAFAGTTHRLPLGDCLRPGDQVVKAIELPTPAQSGIYDLQVTLVTRDGGRSGLLPEPPMATHAVEVLNPNDVDWSRELEIRANSASMEEKAKTDAYRVWADAYDSLGEHEQAELRRSVARWAWHPVISVLVVIEDAAYPGLQATIDSLVQQLYPHWELCIAESSGDRQVRAFVEAAAASDPRIKISYAAGCATAPLNSALALATGAFCQLLGQADVLARHALLFMAGEIVRAPSAQWIYADVDHLDDRGQRHTPVYRCGPDVDLIRSLPSMGCHGAYSTRFLRDSGGFRADDPLHHDVSLRLIETADTNDIVHIPSILYHRGHVPELRDDLIRNGRHLLSEHLRRSGASKGTSVERLHGEPAYRVRYPLPSPPPLVSIIIPTRNQGELLRRCIASITDRTAYPAIEIVVVDNGTDEPDTLRYLEELRRNDVAQVVDAAGPFNWSWLNNRGAEHASGDVLCLLNNDIEAINESWLTELVCQAVRPEVGVAGAALWYADGRMQHGGVILLPESGKAHHALAGLAREEVGQRGIVAQGYSAVTGACMVVQTGVFRAVGGMDEGLPSSFNDVDFCLRVREQLDLRSVWTPHAELFHKEGASRGRARILAKRQQSSGAFDTLRNRWLEWMLSDPHFSPDVRSKWDTRLNASARAGATSRLRRYMNPQALGVAYFHMPGTANSLVRDGLSRNFPPPGLLEVSARTVLRCYWGEEAAIDRLNRKLRDAEILFGTFAYGFAALLGLTCRYGTVVRDPVARVLAHYRQLQTDPWSPLRATPLADCALGLLLRKGIIPGNLMTRYFLGEWPETVTWQDIADKHPSGGAFVGFGLPASVWHGDPVAIRGSADQVPDDETAKVERALEALKDHFVFVGRQEVLADQLGALVRTYGAGLQVSSGSVGPLPDDGLEEVTPADRALIESYNQLDRELYQRIADFPKGMWLDPPQEGTN